MANTTVAAGNVVTKFKKRFFREYVRNNRFSPYMANVGNQQGTRNIIAITTERQKFSIPLLEKAQGKGVSGSAQLRGNGEKIKNHALTLTPTYHRHAAEFDKEELEKPAIDLMNAARPFLMDWSMEKVRDDTIQAMGAAYDGTTYANYGDASAAVLDTWNTNNSDRILYGAAKANYSSGDHTASLATIDTTNDKATAAMMSVAKRMAQQSSGVKITPVRTREDDEMFVAFCDPYAFRDLRDNLDTKHQNAMPRDKTNPIWKGGDLYHDNIIYREIPEIADFIDGDSGTNGVWGGAAAADGLNTAGASSSRVGMILLCGINAVSYGLGQRPDIIVDRTYDYGFQPGVAVELKHDIDKTFFNTKQYGMVTIFCSAAADA